MLKRAEPTNLISSGESIHSDVPADQFKAHAQEFLQNKAWPSDFLFVTNPDYAFTTAYGLRWRAPNETAYPSTFIIDRDTKVRFAHVSKEHGGRVGADKLLKQL